jgi:hypothetical protein
MEEAQRLLDDIDAWVARYGELLPPLPTTDGDQLVPSSPTFQPSPVAIPGTIAVP